MIRKIISYLLIFIVFFIDQSVAYIYEEPVLNTLLALYIITCFKEYSWTYRTTVLFFILLGSFFDYDRFGIPLLYIIPATFIIMHSKKTIHPHSFIPYLIFTLCLGVHYALLPLIFGLPTPAPTYTIGKIAANIVVMMIIN